MGVEFSALIAKLFYLSGKEIELFVETVELFIDILYTC